MALLRNHTVWTGIAGTPFYSTLHWLTDSVSGPDEVNAAAAALWTGFAAYLPDTLDFQVEGTVEIIDPSLGVIIEQVSADNPTGSGAVGASGRTLESLGSQLQINLYTGQFVQGRQVRGKIYFPGILKSAVAADGRPNPDAVSSAQTAVAFARDAGLAVYSKTNFAAFPVINNVAARQIAKLRTRQL
uniref:Uncharacterized protein n=1 Tax=uncultured prokaryote TaxID=198431 RepID=A0A0H5QNV8_9ZZZZ|nr:hypothetical protein [uncultured prokaryote]